MLIPVNLSLANAYIIHERKCIIVDTGRKNHERRILRELAKHRIKESEVSLILLTHGHLDHFGSARALKENNRGTNRDPSVGCGVFESRTRGGRDPELQPWSFTGRVLKPFSHTRSRGLNPTCSLKHELDLSAYGVDAKVIFTPGHTPGSLSVLLQNGEMIAGDLLMSGLGGGVRRNVPNVHFFTDNAEDLHASILKLVELAPRLVYVGHGGPPRGSDIQRRIESEKLHGLTPHPSRRTPQTARGQLVRRGCAR